MSAQGIAMHDTCVSKTRPPSGGYITLGTQLVAAASALVMVLMSACHSTPPADAFAATAADKTLEARLQPVDITAPLQPFDEGFGAATQAP